MPARASTPSSSSAPRPAPEPGRQRPRPGTRPPERDAVADGQYDLRVVTTDLAGNAFTSPAVTVLVDHTAPTTSALLAPGSPSNAPVTVSFSAADGTGSGVAKTAYSVDGGPLLQGTSVVIPAPGDHSNDGTHSVAFFSTDDVGNVETPANTVDVVIDTTAPSGSGGDPGDYLRGIANLSYSTGAGDVSSVQFQFSPAGANSWANIGAADISPPYEASWSTTLVADGEYDLRAVVTDTTGNVANELLPGLPKTVDNTPASGSITSPAAASYVAGTVTVTANASDGPVPPASGVSAVRFEIKPSGAGAFTVFGTQTAPTAGSTYSESLATGALADGPADLQVVVTDVAGNETTSATHTINIDNLAPTVTLDDPGAAVGSSVGLTATSSPDTTDVTFRYRAVGSGGAGTLIASDGTAPFAVTWTTAPAAETQWELIAVATDAGGNVTTSAPRVVLVDRTQPTGSVTAPANGDTTGGPTVAIAANAADLAGSGVTSVVWEVMEFGSAVFTPVATDTSAPYSTTWNSTSSPDGATSIRAVITDAAGNTSTTAAVSFSLDSTGPSVSLADPGAIVGGTISLSATTGGGAARVVFSVAPAGSGTWTEIANDTSAPFGTPFDTSTLPDALYDLRAVGFDALDNASAPALRTNVRFDNTAPILVSSAPADGTVSTSANQIVLTANEPVTAPGALLNGVAAPAPTISGSTLTFATGSLPDGIHVLSGELEDASGTRSQFRVAVSIQNIPTSDPPPVERSITAGGDFTVTLPGGLVTVKMPAGAWPTPPTPQDYILVLRVDAGPAGPGFAPGSADRRSDRTLGARGHLRDPVRRADRDHHGEPGRRAGDPRVVAGRPEPPQMSWNNMGRLPELDSSGAQPDGFHGNTAVVNVLTHHLTFFGLKLDAGLPTPPRHIAGVVAADGLDAPLDPRHRRERPARQRDALRQRRGIPHLRPSPVRDQDGPVHARRQPQCSRWRSRRGRKPEASTAGAPRRAAARRPESRPGGGRSRRRRLRARHRARTAGRGGCARHRRRADGTPARSPVEQDRSGRLERLRRAADAARLLGRRLEDAHAEEADDDRRAGQRLQARVADRHALDGGEEAALHLEGAAPQGGCQHREADPAEADSPARDVHADLDRPLRHRDGQPHDQAEARRQEDHADQGEPRRDRGRARRRGAPEERRPVGSRR